MFLVSPPVSCREVSLFGSEKLSICCTISFCFLTIDTLWGAVVPGYRLHLESERRSVEVRLELQEESEVSCIMCSVLDILLCCWHCPESALHISRKCHPSCLAHGKTLLPVSAEAPAWLLPPSLPPRHQPWHLPSNDQVHLLPKKYYWLFLNVLRAPCEIPNGRYHCREHSVCCVLQQLRRSRALQGSPGADHGGCCAVGMGRSHREENFDLNFCPPKICSLKNITSFSLTLSSSDLTIYESLQIPVTSVV